MRHEDTEQSPTWRIRRGLACLLVAVSSLAVVSNPARADSRIDAEAALEPHVFETGATFDLDEANHLLLRQVILERSLEEERIDRRIEEMLGRNRCRDLDRARFMYDLHAPHFGRDPRDDPRFDDARDAVFSAWKKIQRERLEESIGLEAWWDRKRARMRGRSGEERSRDARRRDDSWSVRLSPRLSDDSVGLRMRLRGTSARWLDHMSFRYKYEVDESHPVFTVRFEDRLRYFDLDVAPDTPEHGDRVGLSVRYSW